MSNNNKYFFGNLEVTKEKKINNVKGVFNSVAEKYDIMNDVYQSEHTEYGKTY